jgi:catechol 2,3-dioxygenase-like lactoylglutathione lyase family enzyme
MSGRLRLAPMFLIVVVLAVAVAFHLSPSGAGSPVEPTSAPAVGGVAITVGNMDRSIEFYSTVLFFEKVSDVQTSGPEIERLFGVAGARVRVVTLRLGAERLELVEYVAPRGRAIPADTRSNDRWFQHIAIVVNDMDQAYLWLRRHGVSGTSPAPQQLPDWNPTEGIRTFSFKDPDGHALELLQFPPDKGDPRWQRPSDRVFLGIDHAAIVVGDTEASLRFYRDRLGLQIVGGRGTEGPEHDGPINIPGARLRITTLRAAGGPAIELLEYLAPRDGRAYPRDTKGNDLARWHTLLVTPDVDTIVERLTESKARSARPTVVSTGGAPLGFRRGLTTEDPDGHGVELRAMK